jgi:mannose-6-phosphate isomerase
VAGGPYAGFTLDELVARYGVALLGTTVAGRFGTRFPLLIKLLDCADWLSIQVHPNDDQARRMVGPEEFGKTEAWYVLNAAAGAQLIAGVKPGVGRPELVAAIRNGRILEIANRLDVHEGDALLVPAGTIHAVGPGLMLYEIQQASDTTYRVYDWGRPVSVGRKLHIEESVEVTLPVGPSELHHPVVPDSGTGAGIECGYFDLDVVCVSPDGSALTADTRGSSFHIVTVVEGTAEIATNTETIALGRLQTALVAGATGSYEVRGVRGPSTLMRAAVPD